LQLRTRDDTIYSKTGYRDWTLVGQVIEPKPWTQPNTVWLHAQCEYVPIREIRLTSITGASVLANNSTVESPDSQTDFQQWEFTGSNGSLYNVSKKHAKYTCTCPGFQFRGRCRHVEQVLESSKEAA